MGLIQLQRRETEGSEESFSQKKERSRVKKVRSFHLPITHESEVSRCALPPLLPFDPRSGPWLECD